MDTGYIIKNKLRPYLILHPFCYPKGSVTMTNKFLGLMTTLLLLSACTLALPSTPDISLVETAVIQTLTALPSPIPPTNTPIVILSTSTPLLYTPTLTPTEPVPTFSPIPTLTSTAIVRLPTALPVYSPQYPDQFIRYYYSFINRRNYQLTWSLLSDSFKFAVNGADQGGFLGYADFWDTVQRVDIFGVSVTSQSGNYAVVNVNMQYTYQTGVVTSNLQTFNLIYDPNRSTWLFYSFTPLATQPPPPVILQTPGQFIYNYFANINAGNYGLAWSLLTDRFKTNVNHNSYDDYANFWGSVSRLDITGVSIESQTGTNAVVTVGLVFNYRSGQVTTSSQRFYLFYDSARGTWLFDSPY